MQDPADYQVLSEKKYRITTMYSIFFFFFFARTAADPLNM